MPTTVALARAEISNRGEFARLLEATVPDNWPPESIADALPLFLGWLESAPDCGWFGWYALAASEGSAAPVLVGSGGFMGPPKNGTVDIGYSVLTQFQGQGFATEMVGALLRWALRQPGVVRVAAQTEWANPASVRVLTKVGFIPVGLATQPTGTRFEYSSSV
jgi:[ribosomal protein S5]-alanine N-acetyltransferase